MQKGIDIMKEKFKSVIRGIGECPKKVFAIFMGAVSAYCWQLFTLFTTWFGFHTKLPLRVFIPAFQTLVFCAPVLMLLWCYWTNCALKKKGGRAKLTGITFVIFLISIAFGAISMTGKVGGPLFWIITVVFSLVISLIIRAIFLRKPRGQVSDAEEESDEETESDEEDLPWVDPPELEDPFEED